MNDSPSPFIYICAAILLIVTSNIVGHVSPPFSIFATPLVVPLASILAANALRSSPFRITVMSVFGLLLFNDVFIRLFAGGSHDQEGKGWIALFTVIAGVIDIILLFTLLFFRSTSDRVGSAFRQAFIILIGAALTFILYDKVIQDI